MNKKLIALFLVLGVGAAFAASSLRVLDVRYDSVGSYRIGDEHVLQWSVPNSNATCVFVKSNFGAGALSCFSDN